MSRVMVSGNCQDLLSDTDCISPLIEANSLINVLRSTGVSWRENYLFESKNLSRKHQRLNLHAQFSSMLKLCNGPRVQRLRNSVLHRLGESILFSQFPPRTSSCVTYSTSSPLHRCQYQAQLLWVLYAISGEGSQLFTTLYLQLQHIWASFTFLSVLLGSGRWDQ